MKKIIFVFIIFLNLFSLFAAPTPNWVMDVDSEYPKEIYLARLGTGLSIENAQANALGQLASYFNSQVVVDTKTSNKMVNSNDTVTKNQTINQEINVISEVSLVAVEYSKAFYNKKEKKYYVVAYMNREQAWKNIEDKLNASLEKYENFQDMADLSNDIIMKYKYSKKANQAGEEFLEEVYKGFLINPEKRKEYKKIIAGMNLKIEENNQITVPVVLDIKGDCDNIFATSISNELKKLGFSIISDASSKDYCLFNMNVFSDEKLDDDVCFVYPEVCLSLENIDGSKKYYSYVNKWGKTAGFSLVQAQKKSFQKISEELENFLSEDIRKSFLEN